MDFNHLSEKFGTSDNLNLVKVELLDLVTKFVKELPSEEIVSFKNKLSEICYSELQARSEEI